MTDAKTFTGGCHCGAIRYEVTTDLARVIACNCSICSKKGHLLTFVEGGQFRLTSGGDADLTDYQFNKHVIHHVFCKRCGIQSFARGKSPRTGADTFAVNVRCLDDVDVGALSVTPFEGKNL
jgi:hypothetical protein